MVWHSIRTALVSIWTKKTRSFLTMLGIIIGVAQIIALIGLGQGVKSQIASEVTQLGSNLLITLPGKVQDSQGGFNPAASIGASTLTEKDVGIIRSLPDVELVSPVSLLAGLPAVGDIVANGSLIAAVEPSYFTVMTTVKISAGRSFNDQENSAKQSVMVLGGGPAKILFPGIAPPDIVGQTVRIGKTDFGVVGVTETSQSTSVFGGNQFDSFVFIPYATGRSINENTQIFRLAVKTKADTDVKAVANEVRAALKQEHGIEDFTVFTQEDLLKVVDSILGLITTAIVGLASISLIVGGIGIMNIMLVAVTERTKEIGVRKAVGASFWHILMQFLVESVTLSLLGGAIGVAIAWAASIFVKQKAGLTILIDLNAILIATLFSLGIGVIFGLAPAIRAARKDPIEALRYE
ncbi:MAG: ABC transporter permease [Patescibacteria group bacterium]